MKVKSVAVIGADVAGQSIAHVAALSGYRTVLEDVSDVRLAKAIAWIAKSLEQGVASGRIAGYDRDAAIANLSTASRVGDAIRGGDLIVETLPEEMEMKLELFTVLDKFAKPNAIFASVGRLSITELAEITFCADRCIGMRFVPNAVETEIVELIKGSGTSPETVAACFEMARRMGKNVVVVEEANRADDRHWKVVDAQS